MIETYQNISRHGTFRNTRSIEQLYWHDYLFNSLQAKIIFSMVFDRLTTQPPTIQEHCFEISVYQQEYSGSVC